MSAKTQNHSQLPNTRSFLNSLFASFPRALEPENSSAESPLNPLNCANNPAIKPLFLTLHVIFPNEVIPALDLLDRRLVSRLIYLSKGSGDGDHGEESGHDVARVTNSRDGDRRVVYYVKSSQQPRSRFSSANSYANEGPMSGHCYEVRLGAWNCTCPAFAFAAVDIGVDDDGSFGFYNRDVAEFGGNGQKAQRREDRGEVYGGLMLGEGQMPICKHLLACLLVESWLALEVFLNESIVSKDEMSGWAGGWGG
ncbi:MAG: hypothetical protein Q9167_001403 [Letrouitia subvulpina]